jgi:hypothetical protein
MAKNAINRGPSILPVRARARYYEEPLLRFADDRTHVDPRLGISRFGPKSYKPQDRHPTSVRVGFVGTPELIAKAKLWLCRWMERVPAEDTQHPEFPGFRSDRGFFSDIVFDEKHWTEALTTSELRNIDKMETAKACFEALVSLIEGKLEFLSTQEQAPEYVMVCLSNRLFDQYHVADYYEGGLGEVHRDLRRAIKARAMKHGIPTQIVLESKLDVPHSHDNGGKVHMGQYVSEIAWNIFSGLYYKAGGYPWGPSGLRPGTCYMGISFYRPLGKCSPTMQTSLVQAFDEHGDGLVLRGIPIDWDPARQKSSSPHFSSQEAGTLIELVLQRYHEYMHQMPERVVIHKTSHFWPAEADGFEEALSEHVDRYDLVTLYPQSTVRLFPLNDYPTLRGTQFSVGDVDYLYTTGYMPLLDRVLGIHVPSPVRIADHIGRDTPRDDLIHELLALTKLNWNSVQPGGLMPITLRFARRVGDIMREVGDDAPKPNYKFYM